MRRSVYLHVGASLTGSAYLRESLARHRRRLARAGVLFPTSHLGHAGGHLDAVLDVLALASPGNTPATGAWDRLAETVRDWRRGTVVLSHELLADATLPQVERVLGSFGDAEVHVVYAARDLGRQLPLAWQEWVRNGGTAPVRHLRRPGAFPGQSPDGAGVLELPRHRRRAGAVGGLPRARAGARDPGAGHPPPRRRALAPLHPHRGDRPAEPRGRSGPAPPARPDRGDGGAAAAEPGHRGMPPTPSCRARWSTTWPGPAGRSPAFPRRWPGRPGRRQRPRSRRSAAAGTTSWATSRTCCPTTTSSPAASGSCPRPPRTCSPRRPACSRRSRACAARRTEGPPASADEPSGSCPGADRVRPSAGSD